MQVFNEASMAFQTKTVANGGLGQETYLPEGERVCVMSVQQAPDRHQVPTRGHHTCSGGLAYVVCPPRACHVS